MNTTNDQAKYNQLFHAAKLMFNNKKFYKKNPGPMAWNAWQRAEKHLENLIKIEIEERKRAE